MPTISQFYGIKIYIFYNDHNEPHFHVYYGEYEAEISIKSGDIIKGSLPQYAKKMVFRWRENNVEELLENWALAGQHKGLKKIAPLE